MSTLALRVAHVKIAVALSVVDLLHVATRIYANPVNLADASCVVATASKGKLHHHAR